MQALYKDYLDGKAGAQGGEKDAQEGKTGAQGGEKVLVKDGVNAAPLQ